MRTASCVALAFMGTAHGLPIFSAERRQLVNLAPELNPEILSGDNSCFGLGVSVCDPIDVTEKGPGGGPKAIKPPAKPPSDELPGGLQGKPEKDEDDQDHDGEEEEHEDDDDEEDDEAEDAEKPKGNPEEYTGGKGPPLSKLLGGGKGDGGEDSESPSGPLGKLLGMLPLPMKKPGGKGEEQPGDSSGGRLPLPELPLEKKPSSSSSSSPLEALPLPRPSSQDQQQQEKEEGAPSPLEELVPLPRPSSSQDQQKQEPSNNAASSLLQSGVSKLQSVPVTSKIEELMKKKRQLLGGASLPEVPGLKSLAEDPPAISLINVSPEANPELLAGDNTCSGLGLSACDPIDVSEGGGGGKLPVPVPAPPADKGGESKWTRGIGKQL